MKKYINIGIDIGSTTVKVVAMEKDKILYEEYRRHFSDTKRTVHDLLEEVIEKFNSYNYKILIGFIIGVVLSTTSVYAFTYMGSGKDLVYDNQKSEISATNVQDALDEIYQKFCPDGYICVKK